MITLKSLLTELKPMSGKPAIGDYIRSGKLFGKIVEIETRKGKKLAGIEPSSGMPSGFKYGQWGTIVYFDVKKLDASVELTKINTAIVSVYNEKKLLAEKNKK